MSVSTAYLSAIPAVATDGQRRGLAGGVRICPVMATIGMVDNLAIPACLKRRWGKMAKWTMT
jgi:hypothetical protein